MYLQQKHAVGILNPNTLPKPEVSLEWYLLCIQVIAGSNL
jgi:hypothetical protein